MIGAAFPPEWPRSLDDPTAIRDNDWEAFRRVETMIDHWDRPGWSARRRSYHWLLTFAGNDALGALVGRCQDAIAHLCLDLVPANSIHLTMGRLAFTDEISARQADGAAGAARELCAGLSPFDLAFRPHISIAYNNHIRPAAPVIEAVASLRSLAPVQASVAEAQLVILRRDGKAYRWEPLASVQIGTQ